MIPAKKGRRTLALHDRRKYHLRNQIERLFNILKNWRRVATRYDKSKSSYLVFVSLASALLWLPFVHATQTGAIGYDVVRPQSNPPLENGKNGSFFTVLRSCLSQPYVPVSDVRVTARREGPGNLPLMRQGRSATPA
ncbi:hypothetical protein FHR23_001475 [Stakelama sediminis]|uniref:DDE family transposase n=1 Tax=Stakelama sediminis TaxID=463200 RepID=A0A840YYF1_9SPHN|nr:hypothetical protein [Stakelama sediminis]